MSTEEHDLTIRVETSESHYEDTYANATITFTSDGKSIKLDYDTDGNGIGSIMPTMLKDIKACIEDPDKWIATAIKQGPENIEKLREYEQELAQTRKNIISHQSMIEIESKRVEMYQKKVDELKGKMKQ